jgi:hypothetical protein
MHAAEHTGRRQEIGQYRPDSVIKRVNIPTTSVCLEATPDKPQFSDEAASPAKATYIIKQPNRICKYFTSQFILADTIKSTYYF